MGIEEIEKAIVEKLQSKIIDLKVDGFPDNPETYNSTTRGEILVRFHGSQFKDSPVERFIAQERKMQFLISISITSLRKHHGAYYYLDKIRKALTGYKIPDKSILTKMSPKTDEFISYEDNKWTYGVVFEFKMLTSEDEDED